MSKYNSFIILTLNLILAQVVYAGGGVVDGGGLGDMTRYVSCTNTRYHFTITGTAVPTFFSGQVFSLETDDSVAQLGCQRVQGQAPTIWTCTDYENADIKIEVKKSEVQKVTATWFSAIESEPLIIDTFECELKESGND